MHLVGEGGSKVGVGCLEIVGKSPIGGVVPQRSLESLGGCAPFWGESADGYAVTSDDDGLAALDLVKDVREVPCCLSGCYRNHSYILSDLI